MTTPTLRERATMARKARGYIARASLVGSVDWRQAELGRRLVSLDDPKKSLILSIPAKVEYEKFAVTNTGNWSSKFAEKHVYKGKFAMLLGPAPGKAFKEDWDMGLTNLMDIQQKAPGDSKPENLIVNGEDGEKKLRLTSLIMESRDSVKLKSWNITWDMDSVEDEWARKIPDEEGEAVRKARSNYGFLPICVYGPTNQLLKPPEYAKKLRGSIVEAQFRLQFHNVKGHRSFTAEIHQLIIWKVGDDFDADNMRGLALDRGPAPMAECEAGTSELTEFAAGDFGEENDDNDDATEKVDSPEWRDNTLDENTESDGLDKGKKRAHDENGSDDEQSLSKRRKETDI